MVLYYSRTRMILKLLPLLLLFNTTLGTFINSSLLFTSFDKKYYEEKLKIEGFIPRTINGTIYRNGFGKFEGNGFKLNHLFDSLSCPNVYDLIDFFFHYFAYFQKKILSIEIK